MWPDRCWQVESKFNLAEKFKGVIINADPVQIYREIKILSGRPTSDDYRQAPHRLYGIMSIFKPCTWYLAESGTETIRECELSGRLPIICGGTGLYIKFLLNNYEAIPEIPPSIKLEAREKLEDLGNEISESYCQKMIRFRLSD